MRKTKFVIFILIISFFAGCSKESNPVFTETVGFYLISNYNTKTNSVEIINSSIQSFFKRIVFYNEIQDYDSTTHTFTVSSKGLNRIRNLDIQISGVAFSLNVKDQVILSGYFIPGQSNEKFDCIVIDENSPDNKLHLRYGYPDSIADPPGDPRNDPRLIQALVRDGKLIPVK